MAHQHPPSCAQMEGGITVVKAEDVVEEIEEGTWEAPRSAATHAAPLCPKGSTEVKLESDDREGEWVARRAPSLGARRAGEPSEGTAPRVSARGAPWAGEPSAGNAMRRDAPKDVGGVGAASQAAAARRGA